MRPVKWGENRLQGACWPWISPFFTSVGKQGWNIFSSLVSRGWGGSGGSRRLLASSPWLAAGMEPPPLGVGWGPPWECPWSGGTVEKEMMKHIKSKGACIYPPPLARASKKSDLEIYAVPGRNHSDTSSVSSAHQQRALVGGGKKWIPAKKRGLGVIIITGIFEMWKPIWGEKIDNHKAINKNIPELKLFSLCTIWHHIPYHLTGLFISVLGFGSSVIVLFFDFGIFCYILYWVYSAFEHFHLWGALYEQ